MSNRPEPAFNPLPPLIWALALPIIAMEVVLVLAGAGLVGGEGGIGWRLAALQQFVYAPEQFAWMLETGRWTAANAGRLISYAFVHAGLTHAAFVLVFLLALGKFISDVQPAWTVVAIFVVSAVGGALIYTVAGQTRPLVGGYPAVFGLVGAFTFLLWMRLDAKGENPAQAFTLIGLLLFIRLLFGLLFGGGPDWIADLGGFGVGFAAAVALNPRGRAQLRARLRHR